MENQKYLLTILRTLNLLAKQTNREKNRKYVETLAEILTPSQKQTFLEMAKAMILLTAGSVEVVREPQRFDDRYLDAWHELISRKLMKALNKIIPSFDVIDYPTREDYELANDLLPLLGSSFLTTGEIEQYAPDLSPEEKQSSEVAGYETLYRGLSKLDLNIIKFIMTKPNWDTEQPGVSTSYNKGESASFAALNRENGLIVSSNGPSIFFTINNPNRKGFIADKLSAFSREQEVIISGTLKVDSWIINLIGSLIEYSEGSNYIFKTNVTINSENQTILFKNTEGIDETMQFDSEEEFTNYAKFLIERKQPFPEIKLPNTDKKYEWVPSEYSIMALVNATLI